MTSWRRRERLKTKVYTVSDPIKMAVTNFLVTCCQFVDMEVLLKMILLFHILFLVQHITLFADSQHIAWPFRTVPGSVVLAVVQTESPYLLICLAHQGPMPRLLANILDHVLDWFVIFLLVDLETETLAPLQNSCSQKRCFFPNTSRKYQCIDFALQLDVVAADEAKDAVNENIEC